MSSDLQVGYSIQFAINENTDEVDVLTGDEFRAIVNDLGNPEDIALLVISIQLAKRNLYNRNPGDPQS